MILSSLCATAPRDKDRQKQPTTSAKNSFISRGTKTHELLPCYTSHTVAVEFIKMHACHKTYFTLLLHLFNSVELRTGLHCCPAVIVLMLLELWE